MNDLFGSVSTADTGSRSDLDFYETPAWMTRSLLWKFPIPALPSRAWPPRLLEPCSGRDAITTVLRTAGYKVRTNDIDPRHPSETHEDATSRAFWESLGAGEIDWTVTNPTFRNAIHVLKLAYEFSNLGVIMLLRKSFLEPTGDPMRPKPDDRGPWLASHPPTGIVGQPRHSFRGTGSDSQSCDWMIWDKRKGAPSFITVDFLAETR